MLETNFVSGRPSGPTLLELIGPDSFLLALNFDKDKGHSLILIHQNKNMGLFLIT